jgi:hypothetical protein
MATTTTKYDQANKLLLITISGAPGTQAVTVAFPYHPLGAKGVQTRITMPATYAAARCLQQKAVDGGVSVGSGASLKGYAGIAWDSKLFRPFQTMPLSVDPKAVAAMRPAMDKICSAFGAAVTGIAEGLPVPPMPTVFQTGTFQADGTAKGDGPLSAVPTWAWVAGLGALAWVLLRRRS